MQTVKLPELLDFHGAEEIINAMKAADGADVTLDASGVRRFGAAGAQALIVAAAHWKTAGRQLALTNVPENVHTDLDLMGINIGDLTSIGEEDT